jgi:hypothetical protein
MVAFAPPGRRPPAPGIWADTVKMEILKRTGSSVEIFLMNFFELNDLHICRGGPYKTAAGYIKEARSIV